MQDNNKRNTIFLEIDGVLNDRVSKFTFEEYASLAIIHLTRDYYEKANLSMKYIVRYGYSIFTYRMLLLRMMMKFGNADIVLIGKLHNWFTIDLNSYISYNSPFVRYIREVFDRHKIDVVDIIGTDNDDYDIDEIIGEYLASNNVFNMVTLSCKKSSVIHNNVMTIKGERLTPGLTIADTIRAIKILRKELK